MGLASNVHGKDHAETIGIAMNIRTNSISDIKLTLCNTVHALLRGVQNNTICGKYKQLSQDEYFCTKQPRPQENAWPTGSTRRPRP